MVSNQGGCDSFGYGTADLVLYPVYIYMGTIQGIQFYTNVLDWGSVQRDSNDVLQGVKLYDKNTYQELVGWYVKLEVYLGLWYIYNPEDKSQAFDGYMTDSSDTVTLPTGGEFQPTTYFKVPKKVGRVLVRSQKPTADNNYTWYNLYADGWVEQGGYVDTSGSSAVSTTYPIELKDAVCPDINFVYGFQTDIFVKIQQVVSMTTTGFTTRGKAVNDTNKVWENANFYWQVSGYANSAEYTKDKWNYQNIQVERCMVQLFNSTTDTAVATCNQVLADVSALNQGDYVIYWDSYEASDHSHAYTGITLAEYQWYRIYKSGWVEQGITKSITGGTAVSITLPITMNSANYSISLTQRNSDSSVTTFFISYYNPTSTGFFVNSSYAESSVSREFEWQVSGFSFLA